MKQISIDIFLRYYETAINNVCLTHENDDGSYFEDYELFAQNVKHTADDFKRMNNYCTVESFINALKNQNWKTTVEWTKKASDGNCDDYHKVVDFSDYVKKPIDEVFEQNGIIDFYGETFNIKWNETEWEGLTFADCYLTNTNTQEWNGVFDN